MCRGAETFFVIKKTSYLDKINESKKSKSNKVSGAAISFQKLGSAKNETDHGFYNTVFLPMNGENATKHAFSSTNATKSASKDKILIWIGDFAIDSERVAIAILITGMLFLFGLITHSWRKECNKKRRNKAYRIAQQDLPPTYAELMLRKKPPAYKESLMQVIETVRSR